MTTIPTEDPVAVGAVKAIHAGDVATRACLSDLRTHRAIVSDRAFERLLRRKSHADPPVLRMRATELSRTFVPHPVRVGSTTDRVEEAQCWANRRTKRRAATSTQSAG